VQFDQKREQLFSSNMQVPTYLQQTDNKNRKELVKTAVSYFWELVKQHNSKEKARSKVVQKTGIVI